MKTKSVSDLPVLLLIPMVLTCAIGLSACTAAASKPTVKAVSTPVADNAPTGRQEAPIADSGPTEKQKRQLSPDIVDADFEQWITSFRARAIANGASPMAVDQAFSGVALVPRILELDDRQPEFSRRIWSYLDILVTPARVENGRAKLARYAEIAASTQREYGVPREIIGAIWGVESSYGENFGNYDTVSALATLVYDGRRRDWAVRQLYAIFKIIDRGMIDRQALRGSWAGAMGHTQFIPTSYLAYAVDGDGDGHIDIWGSIADVMASTANYLAVHGWQPGSPWGVEVVLPANFNYGQARLGVKHSANYWARQGVTRANGAPLPDYAEAAVLAPAGARGPAVLVGPNFEAIMSYNRAVSYALAVGLLSDRLAGQSGLQADWPRQLQPLSRDQVLALQRLLDRGGFDVGTPDGIMGPNTKAGIRAFQAAHGLAADGFATVGLLQRIRRTLGAS